MLSDNCGTVATHSKQRGAHRDNAEYGNYFKTGALLAQKTINDQGGIKGGKLQLLIEDSQADPKEAILIAQKFVSDPRVLAVVGDFNSSASMAAAEIYNDGGLVQISPTASHPDFTKKGEYIFRAGTTQSIRGGLPGPVGGPGPRPQENQHNLREQRLGPSSLSSSKSRTLVGVHVLSLRFMRSGGMEKVARDCRKTCQEGKRT